MKIIFSNGELFYHTAYENESILESAIVDVAADLFGAGRIYLDIKKKIGAKGGQRNIPDGYLLDISSKKPRLYVVENELSAHDPLRHIAVQILQFSLSFESEPRTVKRILFDAIQDNRDIAANCESYANSHGFRNLDHMLEYLVFEAPFAALVIIDEIPENLEKILAQKIAFGVEVLQLERYKNSKGEYIYHFEPFLNDVTEDINIQADLGNNKSKHLDPSDIDTIVVPAREDGFEEVFLSQDRWYAIRIHGSMRPQIKYIAGYQVAPISAITHVAPVKSIEPWSDSGKYVVNFSEPAKKVGPIKLVKGGRVKQLQGSRYTIRKNLDGAKTLDDVW